MGTDPELDPLARRVINKRPLFDAGHDRSRRPARLSPVYYTAARYTDFYWVSSPQSAPLRNVVERGGVRIVIFDSTAAVGAGEAVYLEALAALVPEDELEAVSDEAFGRRRRAAFAPGELRGDARFRLYARGPPPARCTVRARDPSTGAGVDPAPAGETRRAGPASLRGWIASTASTSPPR